MNNQVVCITSGVIEARFGWSAFPRQYSGGLLGGLASRHTSVDCDARAFFCGKDGKTVSRELDECCLYYGNMRMFDGAAGHLGDNQVGGSGDDEILRLELNRIPRDIGRIILSIDLLKTKHKVRMGKIQEAFMRITDGESGEELARTEILGLDSSDRLVVTGILTRVDDCWQIRTESIPCSAKSEEELPEVLSGV
uniref:TerD family protein n=1 Tax=Eubacterium cellulosolvens TaxID=29322 RepID=UPI0004829C96|nr:TerD family protein [[Eubacterium] cellulosolvens]